MDTLFVRELSALLQETERLLACAEPDAAAWEGYGRLRGEVFAGLEAAGFSVAGGAGEQAELRELIAAVLERDRRLMQKLEECIACCRKGLAAVPQARRALNGYRPARISSLRRGA